MRVARVLVPGAVHHVISRFQDRHWVITSDAERREYLRRLEAAFAGSDWQCLAYAVMSSHTHVVAMAGRSSAESWLKRVNGPFAQWLNKRRDGLGHVFADRPSIYVTPDARIPRLIAYVHNNPIRAGLFASARDAPSEWTSHRAYLSATRPAHPAVETGLACCGFSDDAAGRQAFDAFVEGRRQDHDDDRELRSVDHENLRRIRTAARQRGTFELGTPTLEDERAAVPLMIRPYGLVRTVLDPRTLLAIVARTLDLPLARLTARTGANSDARRVAILVGRDHGLSISAVAQAIGISVQAGSKLIRPSVHLAPLLAVVERVEKAIAELELRKLKPSPARVAKRREKSQRRG